MAYGEQSRHAASVGPGLLAGRRLGPDAWNTSAGLVLMSTIRPIKQLLISSQFCKPQRISLAGSGLNGLFGELSKWAMPITRVPFGNKIGLASS